MKRFFSFFAIAVVAMAIVSCDKDEDIIKSENNVTSPDAQFLEERAEYSNYDVNAINELLCDKWWIVWSWAVYDENGEFVKFIMQDNVMYEDGAGGAKYKFTADGKLTLSIWDFAPWEEDQRVGYGTWTFDPETKILYMNTFEPEYKNEDNMFERNLTRRIEGIGKDVLFWDLEHFDNPDKLDFERFKYIVEE